MSDNKIIRTIRCIVCRIEIPQNEIPEDVSECPKCGTESLPEFVDHDVDIRINWHELRILCMWAKNWEQKMAKVEPSVIDIITRQLIKYKPVDAASLTLLGELKEVAENSNLDVELHQDGNITEIKGKRNLH